MQELMKEKLMGAGIDVPVALERFMGNEALLERFLKKFLKDASYEKLVAAIGALATSVMFRVLIYQLGYPVVLMY